MTIKKVAIKLMNGLLWQLSDHFVTPNEHRKLTDFYCIN